MATVFEQHIHTSLACEKLGVDKKLDYLPSPRAATKAAPRISKGLAVYMSASTAPVLAEVTMAA